jgi:hypothetical protein
MKHRDTHPVDDILRRSADQLPVGDPTLHWEALRRNLDQAPPPGQTPQGHASGPDSRPMPGPANWWMRGLGIMALGTIITLWWWSAGNAAASRHSSPSSIGTAVENITIPSSPSKVAGTMPTETPPVVPFQGPADQQALEVAGSATRQDAGDVPLNDPAATNPLRDTAEQYLIHAAPSPPVDTLPHPASPGKKKKFLFW